MNSTQLLEDCASVINKGIMHQLYAQGHLFLEEISESLTNGTKVNKTKKMTVLKQTAVKYLLKMEEGTPPSEINPTSHVRALQFFYQKLGFDPVTAKQKAAVLTSIHQREGSPSRYSVIHSQTGLRKHFIREAFADTEPVFENKIIEGMNEIFVQEFNKQKSERV